MFKLQIFSEYGCTWRDETKWYGLFASREDAERKIRDLNRGLRGTRGWHLYRVMEA